MLSLVAHYTLHKQPCTLKTIHFKLLNSHCTQQNANCKLQTLQWIEHTVCCILHAEESTLHTRLWSPDYTASQLMLQEWWKDMMDVHLDLQMNVLDVHSALWKDVLHVRRCASNQASAHCLLQDRQVNGQEITVNLGNWWIWGILQVGGGGVCPARFVVPGRQF